MRSLKKHFQLEEISIGLIPTRRDKTCSWGCIDVDNIIYNKDPRPLIKKVREKKISVNAIPI
jgi:hypothetical protein